MRKKSKLEGVLFPRAHLTLIGFNQTGYRKYGGIGFSFSNPSIKFTVEAANKLSIEYFSSEGKQIFVNKTLQNKIKLFSSKQGINSNVRFKFLLGCPLHSGFGTGTNIYLASFEAIHLINGMPVDRNHLIELSGRGRTSGIGINTYFDGGYVMDIGVRNRDDVFLPSNQSTDTETAIPLFNTDMPKWEFAVFVPSTSAPLTKVQEKQFFLSRTPLSKKDVADILYEAVYGVSASILQNDFDMFCVSINRLQKTKWKHLERNNHRKQIIKIEAELFNAGAAAIAMSSLGPSLLIFAKDIRKLTPALNKLSSMGTYYFSQPNNAGRIIYD